MLLDQTHPRASHSDIVMYMVNLSRLRQDIVVVEKDQIDCRFADYIDHKMMQVVAGSGTAADRWVPTSHYLSSSHRRSYRQRYIHDHYGLILGSCRRDCVYLQVEVDVDLRIESRCDGRRSELKRVI